jgi:hypothetical protein
MELSNEAIEMINSIAENKLIIQLLLGSQYFGVLIMFATKN